MSFLEGRWALGADLEPEGHVLEDGHVAEEGVVLEDETDPALVQGVLGRVAAIEDHSSRIRLLQAGDDAQDGGLARSRGAQEGHQLPGLHLEVQVLQDGVLAEAFVEVRNLDAHEGISRARRAAARMRHSRRDFSSRVTRAVRVRSEAQAKAAVNWYSL